jgi:hypothetical protein
VGQVETGFTVTGTAEEDNISMHDGNYDTFKEFPLTASSNTVDLIFHFNKPITSSSLFFSLDNNVALPQNISISTPTNGGRGDHVVLAPIRPSNGNIVFPKTTSDVWSVVFSYVQPLRISEIKFNDDSIKVTTRGLRFLAQPGQKYQIYFDADRYVTTSTKEAGDLFSSSGIVYSDSSPAIPNPEYKPADTDKDSVPDRIDNCVSVSNMDQLDEDKNGLGDACEDYDRDGVYNSVDNCRDLPNSSQVDTDADGKGDICDELDNRVGERLPWLPWAGIGLAGLVIGGLFAFTFKHKIPPQNPLN